MTEPETGWTEPELKDAKVAADLCEDKQRYGFLADAMPLIIWTARPDGGVDYYNKAWFDYTGLTLAQTEVRGWGAVLHPDDFPHCVERWTHSFTTGETYEIEYRFKRGSDGSYRWFLGRAAARRNDTGEIVQWVGTCTDIDDKKRTENELLLARSKPEHRVIERTAELVLTNEQLLRQQTELRVLFDLMPALIWFKDTEDRILRVNQRVAENAGKTIAEIEGKHSREIYPHDAARFYADDLAVIHSARPKLGYVEAVRDPAGREVWVQTDRVPYFDPDGKVIGLVVMAQDITARKRADEALRESEERFSDAFEFSAIGVALVSPDGRWLKVNRALCSLLGYSEAELLSRTFQEVTYPEDLEKDLEFLRRTIAGELRTYQMEKRYVHAQGQVITVWLNVSLVRDAQGRPSYFISQIQDITERKRAEELLRSSEAEFRSLAEAMPHMVWITRPDGWNTYISQQWLDYTGLTLEESLGRGWNKPFHPQDRQRAWETWQQAKATVGIYSVESRLRRADGVYRWWLIRGVPQRDASGQVSKWFGTCTDIDEMKQAELEISRSNQALRESNDKFELLANHITDAFWIRSPDLKTVHYVSPAFERIWGRSVESLYAHPEKWSDFIMPEDRARVLAAFAALSGDALTLDIEYRIVRPDGEVRWIHVRGFRVVDATGKIISHTGIVTDITGRKRADEALRASEARYRSLIENARDAIFTIAPDGTFTSLNPAVERMAGLARADWIGKSFAPMVHPEDRPLAIEMFQKIMQGDQAPVHELRGSPLLRRPALMEMTLAPLLSGSGKIVGLLGIGRDITERKQLEVQLFQSQKMETVGKLAGGVAHEFNSIMTAIIGQSDLLLHDLPFGSSLTGNVTEIRAAANRAAALTRQLLAYGRKQQFQSAILDLNAILAGLEGTWRNLLGPGVVLSIVPGAGLNAVKADSAQIEQVLLNMVVNADEAMPDGGKLTLETSNLTLPQESANSLPELKTGEHVVITITDTGIGMNETIRSFIFEPFFTTKGVGEGSGLGLSTSYGIIKQSGGHISVSSEPGRGSTFKIFLPKATRVTAPAVRSPSGSRSGKETILLVERDRELREMSTDFLQQLGYTVSAAADGVEALNLDRLRVAGPIDLLLTEFAMPQMSGPELWEQMRTSYPDIKVLMVVTNSENSFVNQGTQNKGASILIKPFTPSALVGKIREALGQPAP